MQAGAIIGGRMIFDPFDLAQDKFMIYDLEAKPAPVFCILCPVSSLNSLIP